MLIDIYLGNRIAVLQKEAEISTPDFAHTLSNRSFCFL